MAKNPDPLLQITSYAGKTRTLDDWATVFNLAIVVLPDRPEGADFLGIVDRIFATFGDSDVRTIICVPTGPRSPSASSAPTSTSGSCGATPSVRSSTASDSSGSRPSCTCGRTRPLVSAAQGWSPSEWQKVADEIARHEHWTSPIVSGQGDPQPTPGWPIAS